MKLVNFMPDPNSNLTIPEQMRQYHDAQSASQWFMVAYPIILTIVLVIGLILLYWWQHRKEKKASFNSTKVKE